MKRSTLVTTLASATVLAAALAWAFAPRPIQVELAEAKSGRYLQTIDEDAKTRLTDRYQVSAPLTGRLTRIALREGDVVSANAVVATLTPVLPAMLDERSSREMQARMQAAEAGLERASAHVERTRVSLAQAKAERLRSEQLSSRGFIAATKLETDRLMEMAAQKEIDAALAERHVATHDLDQAKAALFAARRPAANTATPAMFDVRAPASGQVMRVFQTSEATVPVGTALLEIGDASRLEVVVELLTTDALSAKPGSPVIVERWGGPGTLQGRVVRIEPAGFTKVSALGVEEQRVRAIIELVSPADQWRRLGDGYRVSVRIVIVDEASALLVPVGAVFPLTEATLADTPGGRRHAVFTLNDGRAAITPVSVAGRNGVVAWIGEGLSAGQRVVVYPPGSLRDGARAHQRGP